MSDAGVRQQDQSDEKNPEERTVAVAEEADQRQNASEAPDDLTLERVDVAVRLHDRDVG